MDSEDIRFKEYFPDIKALEGNEHSEFDNSEELYKLSKTKRKNVMKDIAAERYCCHLNLFISVRSVNMTNMP